MILPSNHSKRRLIKRFASLGPYLREGKCTDDSFFFDCLAVCINVKPTPEKREFLGWWLDLQGNESHFTYAYHFGLFNKEGQWTADEIKDAEVKEKLDATLKGFHQRLSELLASMELTLIPADGLNQQAIKLPV